VTLVKVFFHDAASFSRPADKPLTNAGDVAAIKNGSTPAGPRVALTSKWCRWTIHHRLAVRADLALLDAEAVAGVPSVVLLAPGRVDLVGRRLLPASRQRQRAGPERLPLTCATSVNLKWPPTLSSPGAPGTDSGMTGTPVSVISIVPPNGAPTAAPGTATSPAMTATATAAGKPPGALRTTLIGRC
jgi:hypothetical protein